MKLPFVCDELEEFILCEDWFGIQLDQEIFSFFHGNLPIKKLTFKIPESNLGLNFLRLAAALSLLEEFCFDVQKLALSSENISYHYYFIQSLRKSSCYYISAYMNLKDLRKLKIRCSENWSISIDFYVLDKINVERVN